MGKRAEVEAGVREGVTTSKAQRVKDLEREVRGLRKANQISKLASAFFAQVELDRRIKSRRPLSTSIAVLLCRWFHVPRRSVYHRPVKAAPTLQARFVAPIKAMIEANPSVGYRRVAHLLVNTGR
ncbi:hypothetical protein DES44_2865 [Roseateles depolymerans]|uniref:Transposase n=1 Tax=Roseateles depolymerans TaxID=76731 RepID=A0A0U3LL35_9BURK|nr:Transposase [Roseateles depolymerans]REG14373.1 hypothetical protein DES44_2865 [Roseateles depolymerans]